MQLMITQGRLARTRVVQLAGWQLGLALAALAFVLMMLSGAIYHFVFLTAAREGWPVVSSIVRLVVRDEIAQRDRFMRENLDAMATKVGQMQAKLVRLEAMSDRVSTLAGVKGEELAPLRPAIPPAPTPVDAARGKGGPFVPFLRPLPRPSLDELQRLVAGLDVAADWQSDVFTFSESRLLQARFERLRVPSMHPVDGPIGSGFGFRTDPFTARPALHTGLDFPAESGTQIVASAGGVVLGVEPHPDYGLLVELDHGNGLVTRYAHCSKALVRRGQLVKQGQPIAEVGSSGRSTGPHLHFEVMFEGVHHDPARFLAGARVPLSVRR